MKIIWRIFDLDKNYVNLRYALIFYFYFFIQKWYSTHDYGVNGSLLDIDFFNTVQDF